MLRILAALLALGPAILLGSEEKQGTLSTVEAENKVEQEMAAREAKKASERSELLAVAATTETEQPLPNGKKLILRRVSPPPPIPLATEKTSSSERLPQPPQEFTDSVEDTKPFRNLSISATVYDGKVSEIRLWHEGIPYEVISNVPFNHLQ